MPGDNNTRHSFAIQSDMWPTDGIPKSLNVNLDFTASTDIQFDLVVETETGRIETVQGVFVDNSANAQPLTLKFAVNNLTLKIPPNSQGLFPVFGGSNVQCEAKTTGGVVVPLFFVNVPMPFTAWGATIGGGGSVTPPPAVVTYTETDGAATGASVQVLAANAARKDLVIEAHSTNAASLFIKFGGAAITNTGFELTPGGIFTRGVVSQQSVNIIGTAADLYSVLEGA